MLIVEDEPLLRLSAMDMVEDAGFEPVEAADADEAVAILEARDDIFLVFTDIEMPGAFDGTKLAAFVAGRWPPVRLIVTSGRVEPDSIPLPEGATFVPKPYRSVDVGAMMAEMAD